jgi:gamma-polyglutamate biosynthesis protein CapA
MNIKKAILISVPVLLVLSFFFTAEPLDYPVLPETEKEKHIILFTGDIMLDRGVRYMVEKHGQDYSFPFLKIKDQLEKADIVFGNLESMISDKGRKIGSIYSFRADPEAMKGLSFAGFDIVSLANNHAFDYDREAFEDTMERLKEAEIAYTGAGFNQQEAHSVTILTLKDNQTKIGFLGYTEFLYNYAFAQENRSGVSFLSEENLERDIKKAKDQVDFLVVTFHYGDEYQKNPNEKQKDLSRKAIDSGADIIIGHHPHVTQSIELYQGKFIVYSLGNLIFDQYFSEETMKGFMFEIEIEGKEVVKAKKIDYEMNEFYQPEVVEKFCFLPKQSFSGNLESLNFNTICQ